MGKQECRFSRHIREAAGVVAELQDVRTFTQVVLNGQKVILAPQSTKTYTLELSYLEKKKVTTCYSELLPVVYCTQQVATCFIYMLFHLSYLSLSLDRGLRWLGQWVMSQVVGCIWCGGLGCCENGFTEELLWVWVVIAVACGCGCGYGSCNFGLFSGFSWLQFHGCNMCDLRFYGQDFYESCSEICG